jgi:hypothetical protein
MVLNGVSTGFGGSNSRYCVISERQHGQSLEDVLRSKAHDDVTTYGRQADVAAVLGMNFNLHTNLAELEIEYPLCKSALPPDQVLSVRDLILHANDQSRQLDIISKLDGQPLRLVPGNMLFPAAGPSLYRVMIALSEFIGYRIGLWERLLTHSLSEELRFYPRLTIDSVVIERRTWLIPGGALPQFRRASDLLETMQVLDDWRRAMKLPRNCFVRAVQLHTAEVDWVDELRRWAVSARRGRRHKPHYIDFHNPFLIAVFLQSIVASRVSHFMLQECLPSSESYSVIGGLSSAEEFLVETRNPPRR